VAGKAWLVWSTAEAELSLRMMTGIRREMVSFGVAARILTPEIVRKTYTLSNLVLAIQMSSFALVWTYFKVEVSSENTAVDSGVDYFALMPNLAYQLRNNFFSLDLTKRFKRFLWNNCLFWREYGLERAVVKEKGRLYTWFGEKPGFGYSGVWLEAQEYPDILKELQSEVLKTYPEFRSDGCLITVYPLTSEEDLDQMKAKDSFVMKGMSWHQVVILDGIIDIFRTEVVSWEIL